MYFFTTKNKPLYHNKNKKNRKYTEYNVRKSSMAMLITIKLCKNNYIKYIVNVFVFLKYKQHLTFKNKSINSETKICRP